MSFDARSILDVLVGGGRQPQRQQGGDLEAISEIFRQFTAGQGSASTDEREGTAPRGRMPGRRDVEEEPEQEPTPRGSMSSRGRGEEAAGDAGPPGGGGLEDILRNVLGGGAAPGGGGGLSDILGKLQEQMGRGRGGLTDILGQVLGQATSGVREGAGRFDEATGASQYARNAVGQSTGRSPEELLAQLRELIANNQLGAGAALGGLGALILGTGTGRSLAASAVKLGGLALIGGLAYKAYQNYQQGQPMLGGGPTQQQQLLAAPEGSGFEPGAVTHDQATTLIRAMIAAAAADGRIDAQERQKILGGLQQGGLDAAAQQFLANEIRNPATVDDLAEAVSSKEEAVQIYTAARITIADDDVDEHEFLVDLAERLGIDEALATHIEAAARSAAG